MVGPGAHSGAQIRMASMLPEKDLYHVHKIIVLPESLLVHKSRYKVDAFSLCKRADGVQVSSYPFYEAQ